MIQGQISGYLDDDVLDLNVLSQRQTVQAIHRLCENGFLVYSVSGYHWPQYPPQSLEDLQPLGG